MLSFLKTADVSVVVTKTYGVKLLRICEGN